MKNISYMVMLASIMAGSALRADLSDKLSQSWQTAKQKAQEVGSKIVDPINVAKYQKLLKDAKQDLINCSDAQCSALRGAYEREKNNPGNYIYRGHGRSDMRKPLADAYHTYYACVKKVCPAQFALMEKRENQLAKRQVGIAVGSAFAIAAVTTGATLGTLGAGIAIGMTEEQKEAFNRKIQRYTEIHKLSPDQAKYFGWIVAAKEYGKGYDDEMLRKTMLAYIKQRSLTEDLYEDNFMVALAAYTNIPVQSLLDLIGWKPIPAAIR